MRVGLWCAVLGSGIITNTTDYLGYVDCPNPEIRNFKITIFQAQQHYLKVKSSLVNFNNIHYIINS